MKTGLAAAALLLALTGAGASAQEAEQPAKKEKKICRTEKMTGSLTRRSRICLTEAEWRELNDRTRRGVDEMTSSASGAPTCIAANDTYCTGR